MTEPIRYQPLRALPAHAYVPGREQREVAGAESPSQQAADALQGAGYLPERRWQANAEYLWGVDLYNAGYFWEAHEVWEALWRAAEHDPVQHAFLQGLIQYAAACLKGVMGDADAARRLAARAGGHLERARAERGAGYMGLDVEALGIAFERFAATDPTSVEQRPRLCLPELEADALPVVELPIDGVLDLHTFRPSEVAALVQDYLDECQQRGILEIRIIHGKGKGTLRRTVQAVLERRDDVLEQRLAPPERGGWGATLVTLRPGRRG